MEVLTYNPKEIEDFSNDEIEAFTTAYDIKEKIESKYQVFDKDELLLRDDRYYNILYPKDGNNLVKCLMECLPSSDCINVITISKRGNRQYQSLDEANSRIDIVLDCDNPELILCVTGDYMLERAFEVVSKLNKNIRIVYITNPKILDVNSKDSLTDEEFMYYFCDLEVVYLFYGYPNIVKSMLYDRRGNFRVLGYNDQVSAFGGIDENLLVNGLSVERIVDECIDCLNKGKKKKKIKGV